jgi:integrase/recombinase XerD
MSNRKFGRRKYKYKRIPLDSNEQEKVKKACKTDRERLIIEVLLETGLRLSEFTYLVREQILTKEKQIEIRDSRFEEGSKGKGDKYRRVPMSPRAKELLVNWFKEHDSIGIGERRIQQIIKELGRKAKISKPVTAHVLRHSFAVTFLDKGGSLPTLMKILGHEDIETTMIYLNISDRFVKDEFSRIWLE